MRKKHYYTWDEFNDDCVELSRVISNSGVRGKVSGIYGVPNGGNLLADRLSRLLSLEKVHRAFADSPGVLVVDDIIDSGETRRRFPYNHFVSIHIRPEVENSFEKTLCLRVEDRWVCYPWEKEEENKGEDIVRRMLEFIGENLNRPGLRETPERVVKMWEEVFEGYDKNKFPKITTINNGEDGILYHDMIIDSGYFFSHCEHHVVPFFGKFSFGYIPDKVLIGASKISRVIDFYSHKLQIAERLVHEIVDCMQETLSPKGLILIMSGRHLCKEMRGVKKFDSPFEVIAVRGCFSTNKDGCKDEFMSRIQRR